MHEFLAPLESEAVEQQRKHLKMVVLLVAHDVNHLVDGIVLETHLRRADVLRHIDAGAVAAQQEFLVETLVGKIGPDRTVVFAEEKAFFEPFLDLFLACEIGFRLVVNLVERHAECLVGLVETGIHPVVHHLPQIAHLGVVLLPFHEHFAGFLDERRFEFRLFLVHSAGHELLDFLAIVLVEEHIVVADEVVSFLAARLGRFAVAPFLPRKHRLADVDAAVVDDVRFYYFPAVGLHNFRQRPTEQVVSNVAEVQRFVGVGRGIFNHTESLRLRRGFVTEILVLVDVFEQLQPRLGRNNEVQKALHDVVAADDAFHIAPHFVFHEPFSNVFGGLFGTFPRHFHERKHHHREVSLEFAARFLQLYLTFGYFCAV